ncbi:MAG: VCBS repeat-containing protein [Bacteroidia bacterium]|nr:VCBS repeat-containing protein [Bacteroidia bacterium]
MSQTEWEVLLEYYAKMAPDSLPQTQGKAQITALTAQFRPHKPDYLSAGIGITLLQPDTARRRVYVGDGLMPGLLTFSEDFHLLERQRSTSGPVYLDLQGRQPVMAEIGELFPSDYRTGRAFQYAPRTETIRPRRMIAEQLSRISYAERSDTDLDGMSDLLICGFGNYQGGLIRIPGSTGASETLLQTPGALRTMTLDWTLDSLPDILVLLAQGNESLVLLEQQPDHEFRTRVLAQFPPSNGSTWFDTLDIDRDGRLDLLYVNGDNGDYPPLMKPYHGVHILAQEDSLKFRERYFFPMHGAFRALARDFDLDGDLDIAALSHFPDYLHRPEESFVYLRQDAPMAFAPSVLESIPSGKWLLMASCDWDRDGDEDLFLGHSGILRTGIPEQFVQAWSDSAGGFIPFLYLENSARSGSLR